MPSCDYTKQSLTKKISIIKKRIPKASSKKSILYNYLESKNELPPKNKSCVRKRRVKRESGVVKKRRRKGKKIKREVPELETLPPENEPPSLDTVGNGIRRSTFKTLY